MNAHATFRLVQPTDNPYLAHLIREVFEEYEDVPKTGTVYDDPTTDQLFELFLTDKAVLNVAEVDGIIAGCCGLFPTQRLTHDCAELVKFYLHKNARGKGIGKKLIQHCIKDAQQMGYHTLYIESFTQFTIAINMYKKMGFTQLQQPLGLSGHTACNVWMIKKI